MHAGGDNPLQTFDGVEYFCTKIDIRGNWIFGDTWQCFGIGTFINKSRFMCGASRGTSNKVKVTVNSR